MNIKSNCWRISNEETAYFVKKYKHPRTFQKVRTIHRALQETTEFLVPVIAFSEPYIVYEWVEGRAADYNDVGECRQVFSVLDQLHKAGQDIYVEPTIQLEAKWHYRLLQFQIFEEQLRAILNNSYNDLLRIAEFSLSRARFPIGATTLLHGDVAHHNFLLTEKKMYMIDVDLAVLGTEADEFLLWMHRLLPHFHYDLYKILSEIPELERYRSYFSLLLFPNELLREWLVFAEQPSLHSHLLAMTSYYLQQWPKLNNQINQLVRTSY